MSQSVFHSTRTVLSWTASVLAAVAVVGLSVVPIMAQTQEVTPIEPVPIETSVPTTIDPAESEPTDLSEPTSSLSDQINDVRNTYRGQLEQYRNQERQYVIALNQYQNLGTLTSLETAVTATQNVMRDRVTVLSTYTNLLRLSVIQQEGVDPAQKQALVSELEAVLAELDQHRQTVAAADDRLKVNALTTEFQPLGKRVEEISYKALSFLSLGRLRTVYTKSQALHERIKIEESQSSSALEKPQRDRAIAETERAFAQIESRFGGLEALAYAPDLTRARSDNQRLREDARPVYTGLNQVLSYLEEIVRLF